MGVEPRIPGALALGVSSRFDSICRKVVMDSFPGAAAWVPCARAIDRPAPRSDSLTLTIAVPPPADHSISRTTPFSFEKDKRILMSKMKRLNWMWRRDDWDGSGGRL